MINSMVENDILKDNEIVNNWIDFYDNLSICFMNNLYLLSPLVLEFKVPHSSILRRVYLTYTYQVYVEHKFVTLKENIHSKTYGSYGI